MPPSRSFLRLLGQLLVITAALILIGYLPSWRLGGSAAVTAMWFACCVTFLASLLGALPLALIGSQSAAKVPTRLLASLALRIVGVIVGALAVMLLMPVSRRPFLVWLAISYVAFLAADMSYALARNRELERN